MKFPCSYCWCCFEDPKRVAALWVVKRLQFVLLWSGVMACWAQPPDFLYTRACVGGILGQWGSGKWALNTTGTLLGTLLGRLLLILWQLEECGVGGSNNAEFESHKTVAFGCVGVDLRPLVRIARQNLASRLPSNREPVLLSTSRASKQLLRNGLTVL